MVNSGSQRSGCCALMRNSDENNFHLSAGGPRLTVSSVKWYDAPPKTDVEMKTSAEMKTDVKSSADSLKSCDSINCTAREIPTMPQLEKPRTGNPDQRLV
uniref:Uncharacterized protein n=1 Tax=Sphaerodactylus townsendi TaxID=933632 RepID=A0ACB8FM22_9SAUR